MTLGNLDALWLLLLVPAMVIFYALDGQRRRRELSLLGHLPQIRRMIASVSTGRRRFKAALLVLSVALVVGALARPQLPGAAHILPRRGLDIAVALDFSRSMLAADVYPTRLDRAKLELNKLIDGLKGDRVGLVAFAGVTLGYPLTSDYAAAKLFWRDLGPSDIPVGGTNLGDAIRESLDLLEHGHPPQGADKRKPAQVIILLTDGADTEGGAIDAAREAAKRGVKIYSVGIGSREGDLVVLKKREDGTADYVQDAMGNPVRMELDEAALRQIASLTGGEYFQLDQQRFGVERVQKAIAALERSEEEGRVVREPDEAYLWFLLPAFLLLVAEALLRERRRRPLAQEDGAAVEPVAQPKTTRRAAQRGGSSDAAKSGALVALLWLCLPCLGGWSWFERPSPDVQEGNEKLAAGKAEEALDAYDRALQARPDDLSIHYDRGAALYSLGKYPEAQREFERAAESNDPALRADSFYNSGNLFLKQEKAKEAIDYYKKTLKLRQDDRRAKWNLELALKKLRAEEEKQKQQQDSQDKDKKDDNQKDAKESDKNGQNKDSDQQNKDQKDKQDQQAQDQEKNKDSKDQQAQKNQQDPKDQKDQKNQKSDSSDSKDQKQAQENQQEKDKKQDKDSQKSAGEAQKKDPKDPKKDPEKEAGKDQKKKPDEMQNPSQKEAQNEDAQNGVAKAGTPPAGATRKGMRDIDRQDAEAVLDAFERIEPTVQKELARKKAGGRRARKDW